VAAKRALRKSSSADLVERERRIRACREQDCEDGMRIRIEEKIVDLTGQRGLDGQMLTTRLVKTRYASRCPSCNPEPMQSQAEAAAQQSLIDERAEEGRRSAGA
jgi:hypothetical protein